MKRTITKTHAKHIGRLINSLQVARHMQTVEPFNWNDPHCFLWIDHQDAATIELFREFGIELPTLAETLARRDPAVVAKRDADHRHHLQRQVAAAQRAANDAGTLAAQFSYDNDIVGL
jgi:hypothetical protein